MDSQYIDTDGQMSPVTMARIGARHLSQIKEESDSREHSSCFLPPIVQHQKTGEKRKPSVVDRQEVRRLSEPASPPLCKHQERSVQHQKTGEKRKPSVVDRQEVRRLSEPASPSLYNHQERPEENTSLLDELSRIEKELRESQHLDEERRREAEFHRQQQNQLLWQNLCYLSLSQRIAKPWVSSYFKKFPMHIYCLPIQGPNHKGRRRGLQRKR